MSGLGGLSVNTQIDPRRMVLGQLTRAKENSNATFAGIQETDHFAKMYKLGAEVMPSVHPGMDVRHAVKLQDQSRVVIKVRRKANSFNGGQEEREWRQSVEFMLNIPKTGSIAQISHVFEDKENYYVVMEKVGGSDLFELLDAEGLLPLVETKAIIRQVLKGVAALHEEGGIHKDLKLENVMVDRSRHAEGDPDSPMVKLIDFDTAQNWEPTSPKAKTVLGTDQYISAEAYAGNYSPASDIFAVGVIAYKLLTGRFPYNSKIFDDEAGENWVGSPKMKQIQERVHKASINWNLPPFNKEPDGVGLVKSMLAPRDNDRPSAKECLDHAFFEDCLSPKVTSPTRKRMSANDKFS